MLTGAVDIAAMCSFTLPESKARWSFPAIAIALCVICECEVEEASVCFSTGTEAAVILMHAYCIFSSQWVCFVMIAGLDDPLRALVSEGVGLVD